MKKNPFLPIIERYEQRLAAASVPKRRMDTRRTFESLTREEILAHAHYLCDGVKEFSLDRKRLRRTGSHLTAIQMCLSFVGWYTLDELMEHNRNLP